MGAGKSIKAKDSFKSLLGGDPKPFFDHCGDEYVASASRFASLLLKISVNFSSSEAAEAFSTEMKVSSPTLDVAAKFAQAAKRLDKHSTVDVSVIQIGGNPGLSGQALCEEIIKNPTPDISKCGEEVVSCGLGKFDTCVNFLQEVIAYGAGNFSKQLIDQQGQPANYAINFVKMQPYAYAGAQFPLPPDKSTVRIFDGELMVLNKKFEAYLKEWLYAERAAIDGVPRLSKKQYPIMQVTASALNNLVKEISVEIEDCYLQGYKTCHQSASTIDHTIAGFLQTISEKSSNSRRKTVFATSKGFAGTVENLFRRLLT